VGYTDPAFFENKDYRVILLDFGKGQVQLISATFVKSLPPLPVTEVLAGIR